MGIKEIIEMPQTDILQNENMVNRAAELMGVLFPYIGIEKRTVNMYLKEIETSDMSPDAKAITMFGVKKHLKELKNQSKIAKIAFDNSKQGTDFSERSQVDEEWFLRYMDAAKHVSSEKMQFVWGKILANEFERPGDTPPNMIRILSEFTNENANAFRKLCGMKMLIIAVDQNEHVENWEWQIAYYYEYNLANRYNFGISLETLNELETLGVIKTDFSRGYSLPKIKSKKVLIYEQGKVIEVNGNSEKGFPVGNVLLTNAGKILMKITDAYKISGYDLMIEEQLEKKGLVVEKRPSFDIKLIKDDVFIYRR